ncbi:MAG TPA: single-stranded DNA-binding protein [Candidatus Dormibacteraeota bacterium]|jgi:single-strand DNA-binding protein|nr:single-stranded DNA-binding protein [Candidatus Dormibacteraeota bacterium]
MINRVTIVGRLTRDPEVHDTASGGRLSNLRIVTDEVRKDADGNRKEEVQYHSVVAFGRLGEICADYLRKGRLVYIEGKLRTREWDGKDGLHRYTTEIVADTMKMLSPKPSDDSAVEAEAAATDNGVPMTGAVA